jgi:CBS domain-containing protein
MFSVYGKAGRIFRGSMEELRKVAAPMALARSRRVQAVALGADHPTDLPTDVLHRTAVAAYQETRKVEAQRHPLSRTDAIMSAPVVTVEDTWTVHAAQNTLAEHDIGQAPVVDASGTLVGLLSRVNLMHTQVTQSVSDVMWTPVPSVAPDTEIRRVARVLLDTGLPGLPVVNDSGGIVGFVSRTDILRAVVSDPPLDLWT